MKKSVLKVLVSCFFIISIICFSACFQGHTHTFNYKGICTACQEDSCFAAKGEGGLKGVSSHEVFAGKKCYYSFIVESFSGVRCDFYSNSDYEILVKSVNVYDQDGNDVENTFDSEYGILNLTDLEIGATYYLEVTFGYDASVILSILELPTIN
ncbi:MAG: hypothetical protein IJF75_00365 [Clostridia bacterium]|nr:hypothetical protein [Clostridia bacterium]